MTSHPSLQAIANISRSKDKQTMKFGLVIEYNMRSIFVEKTCTKRAGETIPRPLSKKIEIECIPGSRL